MKKSNRFTAIIFLFTMLGIITSTDAKLNIKDLNSEIPFDKSVTVGKLDNGLTYYVKTNKKPEDRAELRLVIKAGSILEDEDQKGLAHFVEHMCFNGTESFPKNRLVSFLEETGIRFGADLNASTGFDRTVYMLTLPTDKKDILQKGIQVLEEWAHKVSFQPEEIDKERGVIMEEWRLGKGAQDRIQKIQFPKLLYNSRYAKRIPIGDTSIILHAPYENFTRFYRDWYRPDLMAVIAVGDFDKDEMVKMIKERFGNLKKVQNPKKREIYEAPQHKEIIVSVDTDKELPSSSVSLYFKNKLQEDGNYKGYRNNLIEDLYMNIMNTRLFEVGREPNPPFMGAQTALLNRVIGNVSILTFSAAVKDGGVNQGLESIISEAYRVEKYGFLESELERAKKEVMRNFEDAYRERDKTPSASIAGELVRNFDFGESVPGIDYELELVKTFLPEITILDINNYIKNLISNGSLVVTVSGPENPELKYPTEQEVISMIEKIRKSPLSMYFDKTSSGPFFTKELNEGKIVSENKISEIGVTELKLSNGARVILKPTDFKNDQILFRAFSPGGSSIASDMNYLSADNSASIVDEGGISSFTLVAVQKMLAGKIVNLRSYIDDLSEGFNGSVSPTDLETFFQLLYLHFTEPRLDYEAYDIWLNRMKEVITNSKRAPESALRDTFRVTLSNYHPRRLPLNESVLSEINPDSAFAFYKNRFSNAEEFTFIFVGSFGVEEIKPFLLKYVANLPSTKRKDSWKDIGETTPKGSISKVVKKGVEKKGAVSIAITGDFDYSQLSRYMLRSLTDVMNIKLRERIREEKGGVYGIRCVADMDQYPHPDYKILISFGCDPSRIEELTSEIKKVLQEMKDNKPDETYMVKVKETQKRTYEVSIKENNFWLGNLFSYYFNNENPKDILKYNSLVDSLTAADIQKAAQKYLTDNYIQVVLKPDIN